ncbi:NAD(P)H-dependent oxidoreductase [Nonlabens spongiae]|uniref:NAD(P)H-dependent oxidoreductase n=1 Tax=Nonlabens spongiae TaxID=331648 RepID=A0A1W6MJ40_9FLAO|nr:NAD(P)H-dependent oxidoreductase [Nonlabens spongiae]ARN77602.1 NAD(P)H-dependent oxidoreductase [Nonlabens spongiae]
MENKILEDLKWRYATKKFDPDKRLDQQHIDLLSECFNLTATSYGLQPCKMMVVRDRDVQNSMVAASYGQRQVADCSAVLVICVQEVDAAYIQNYFKLVKQVRNTQNEILKPFEEFLVDSFSNKTVLEIENWARNQAYLILGNLLAVCAAERIDSCPMEGFEPEKIDQLLNLAGQGLKSVLLLPVGYRAEDDFMSTQKKVRKHISESVLNY